MTTKVRPGQTLTSRAADDTAATLQERVQAAERHLLVSTLAALIKGPGKGVGGQ